MGTVSWEIAVRGVPKAIVSTAREVADTMGLRLWRKRTTEEAIEGRRMEPPDEVISIQVRTS
jgi:hypothetical protein